MKISYGDWTCRGSSTCERGIRADTMPGDGDLGSGNGRCGRGRNGPGGRVRSGRLGHRAPTARRRGAAAARCARCARVDVGAAAAPLRARRSRPLRSRRAPDRGRPAPRRGFGRVRGHVPALPAGIPLERDPCARRRGRLRHAHEAARDVAAAPDGRRGGLRRRRRRPGGGHVRGHDRRPGARLRRRRRAQPLPRPRHRPADGGADGTSSSRVGTPRPRAGARVRRRALGGLVRAARCPRQLADCPAGARREPLLRLRVHALAQAYDAAEHRHRRRGGGGTAARRVRERVGSSGLGGPRHVRDRVPVDAAPLLGARADDQGALCARSGADAPGRARRPRDGSADRALLGGARRRHARARGVRPLRARLRCRSARTRRLPPVVVGRAVARSQPPSRGPALPLFAALPRAALRRDGGRFAVAPQGVFITELEAGAGIRLAVKDLFDTAGVRTTYGSAVFADHVPDESAEAVLRLERAGYVDVGKANLHEFAYGVTSQNLHYGTVPNPVAPGRTAGGSSGGSAAAVALGLADAALGTDSGGSIRIPAACCAVIGFKPSYDHAGPLARDVDSCVELMRVLTGLEPADGSGARIGLAWPELAEPLVRVRVEAAGKLLGAVPVEFPLPEATTAVFMREVGDVHRELYAEYSELYGENIRPKIERCIAVTDVELAAATAARERYEQLALAALADVDLLLTPTLAFVPPPADVDELAVREAMIRFTYPFNLLGWPALALPVGKAEAGLPASAQLVGRKGADALVLEVGRLLEAALKA